MSILTSSLKCELGKAFNVKGSVEKGIAYKYSYSIYIGSSEGEDLIKKGLSGADFDGEGIEVVLGEEYVKHAYPYGDGKMCYIKATGTRTRPIYGEETVEYITYFNLFGNLIPSFTLSVTKNNDGFADFGENAVKGFTSVTAKISNIALDYGRIAAVQFTGGVFSKEFTEAKDEYSVNIKPIETAGEIFVFANVLTTHGYQASATASFNVFDYAQPTLKMEYPPTRFYIDENGEKEEIKGSSDGDKEEHYPFEFKGEIKPCEMIADGEQICRIKNIEKTAKVKRVNDSVTADIELTVDGNTVSFSGMPKFKDGTEGTEIFSAYDIEITCKDSTERKYKLVYRLNTLGTAFHLKAGGKGAKFGGYATKDDCLESAWDIYGEKNIEAAETVKGQFFRVTNGIYFSDEDKKYEGVGNTKNTLAQGDHAHGNIRNDGCLVIDGVPIRNAVLITGDSGEITYIKKLTTQHLAMADPSNIVDDILGMQAAGYEASVGTEEAGLCYANHVHPYSTLWKEDKVFTDLVDTVNNLYRTANLL